MKDLKSLKIKDYFGKNVDVVMEITTYTANDQLAILLYNKKTGEYYSDLSVFVEPFKNKNYMAVDTNNLPEAENFIQKYELGHLVDYVYSGFCSYPVYEMDVDKLNKYK
ncbi:MAG: DUF4313 domain-containing protein [Candidatus Absconditabacterales bacterium]|nr:DUF4313 domain-containing protein [Candidatus Absconditabacterales bacterium]